MCLSDYQNVLQACSTKSMLIKMVPRIWIGLILDMEIEMLQIALNLYAPIASGIEVVQSSITSSGRPKKVFNISNLPSNVHLTTITDRIARTSHDMEDWSFETYSRIVVGRALRAHIQSDSDCIVSMDIDELLNPTVLTRACEQLRHDSVAQFGLMWFYTSMLQLALPNTWNIKAAVTAKTFKNLKYDANEIRYSRLKIISFQVPSAEQCSHKVPVGWHCTWCFPTRRQFLHKMRSATHVNYYTDYKKRNVIDNMLCKAHYFNKGAHGKLTRCHYIPNGSNSLINGCRFEQLLPHTPPSSFECPEKIVPCSNVLLHDTCHRMSQHMGERNSIWTQFRIQCQKENLLNHILSYRMISIPSPS
jgi:hypothetical protein